MNKGMIYKLYHEGGVYYGSTTQTLKERLGHHKYDSKTRNKTSKKLFKNGSIPKIELLEEVEFNDIKELRERERYYIENFECINKQIPNRTIKEYYKANKDIINEKKKEYLKIKIICKCGIIVSNRHFARHCRSKKHQKYLTTKAPNETNI